MPDIDTERDLERAANAINRYVDRDPEQHDIADLICDLMHMADLLGFGGEAVVAIAERHYHAEAIEPDDIEEARRAEHT